MPLELRQIIFLPDDLISALHSKNRMSQPKLFEGELVGCYAKPGPQVFATVKTADGNGTTADVQIANDVVLDALLRFCMENNILLPPQAKKTVVVHHDYVVLEMGFDLCG